MTWDRTKLFLSKAVAWPVNGIGYVNLHYSMPNLRKPTGRDIVTGWPGQELDEVVNRAQWMTRTPNYKNIWFCTSLQSQMTTNARGNPKAVRLSANSLLLKALWIDIDIKADDAGHYKDFNEAFAAISDFRKRHGLPGFSAVVKTGGGMHIYWISDKPLTPDEWQSASNDTEFRRLLSLLRSAPPD